MAGAIDGDMRGLWSLGCRRGCSGKEGLSKEKIPPQISSGSLQRRFQGAAWFPCLAVTLGQEGCRRVAGTRAVCALGFGPL